ncbi:MAG: zinc-binding alcohol dehydrogenase [Gammaproteobacteria bacterium]|nr:zinc-binding alcohol dehydrogenase [Gammaproteobacteria bacterium]
MHARAFWTVEPGRGEVRATEIPPGPHGNELLIRTLYTGISRGTETLVFDGAVPPREYERMRAPFQDGDFPGPVKYGYINVGRVEAGPADWVGATVFCLYPHQTHFIVPADAVISVPKNVPPERAILAANLETAVNGIWDSGVTVGDHVAVFGAGVTGALVAWLAAKIPGCEVTLVDVDIGREALADELGVAFSTPQVLDKTFDVLFNVSGSAQALDDALRHAAFESTVVELSWFGDRRAELTLGEAFHSQRLTIRSSQVGAVATAQRPRWTHQRRMHLVLSLLADATLNALISGESDFDELPQVMRSLRAPGHLCHRIRYP